MSKHENLIICDLAETYNIYEYKRLPLQTVAVFVLGLREDSRLMKKISGQQYNTDTFLLAGILDRLSWLSWAKTKDAQKGINQPKPIMSMLVKTEKENKGFETGEDFTRERERILSSLKGGE